MRNIMPSPAVAVVGRHNSGKTTLVCKLIAELASRGLSVGSVKHHGHKGFDIDIPGKDSWHHRRAGAAETIISAPGQVAMVKTIPGEAEAADLVALMTGHDVVIVEGYRKSGLPTIEIMRAANEQDAQVAQLFLESAQAGAPLTTDFIQAARASAHPAPHPGAPIDAGKLPTAATVAVVTDIAAAKEAAKLYGIPAFGLEDVPAICDFLQANFCRPRVSVVIQAGGESRRMGRSKATVPFLGRPLIARLVQRLAPVADELLITTNEPDNLAFLYDEFPNVPLRLVPDLCDFRGALPGILTAFTAATYDYVALVACDMVCASANLIAAEAAEAQATGADAVVPVNRNGYEPMHALYRKSRCLPAVQALVKAGDKRAQSIMEHVQVAPFSQPKVRGAEPAGGCFVNVNTPEELAAAEARLKRSDDCANCAECADRDCCTLAD